MTALEKGSRLGSYVLDEEIGRGGMGSVYRAHQPSLDRTVAIKVLAPHLANDKDLIERFQREARAAANLEHPNIITIFDVGEESGRIFYFAMQYLDGQDLEELVESEGGPLDFQTTVQILIEIVEALDYAHRHGVIHRDIKPANVMMDREQGRVILMDFGIAQAANASRLTRTGQTVGSPEYMSPEQISGQDADHRSDLYALGIVMFEMLTGAVPYGGDTAVAIAFKHVHEEVPAPRDVNPAVPAKLDTICRRLLAKEPDERYESAAALLAELRAALPGAETSTGVQSLPTAVASDEQKVSRNDLPTSLKWGGAAVGALLLIAVLAWALFGRADGSRQQQGTESTPGSAQATDRPSAASATIQTNIEGAQIWVDGAFAGFSGQPLDLDAGEHAVTIRRTGCVDESTSIEVVAGGEIETTVDLDCATGISESIAAAESLFEEGQFEAAWAESDEALALEPGNPEATELKERIEKTLLVLNRVPPPSLEAIVSEARELFAAGQLQEALDKSNEVLDAKPDHRGASALRELVIAAGGEVDPMEPERPSVGSEPPSEQESSTKEEFDQ